MIFALYLVAIPLISPLSWSHHLVFLAAPLWIWLHAAGASSPHSEPSISWEPLCSCRFSGSRCQAGRRVSAFWP